MHPRDPEVEHLDEVGIVGAEHQHHVLGFEVPVHDALRVAFARGVAELQGHVERPGERHRAVGRRERALHRQPVEVLHHDVHRPVGELADEEHVDHVGVREARGHLGLAIEAGNEGLVRRELAVQHLDRHVAVDPALEGAVDAPHRADADELPELDVPEDLAPEVRVARRGGRDDARRRGERRPVERAEERVGRKAPPARRTRLRPLAGGGTRRRRRPAVEEGLRIGLRRLWGDEGH